MSTVRVNGSQYAALRSGRGQRLVQTRGGWLPGQFWKATLCAAFLLAIALGGCSNGNGSARSFDETGQSQSGTVVSSANKSQSAALDLTPTQIRALQALIGQPGASPELMLQAQIILAVAAGMDNDQISRKFGVDADKVDLKDLLDQLQ